MALDEMLCPVFLKSFMTKYEYQVYTAAFIVYGIE